MIAQKELKKLKRGKSVYKHILTNFYCSGCEKINIFDLAKYYVSDSLILIDEITLDIDSRDYKSFPKELKEFFVLHRHLNNDIIYFCQDFERVDKTVRNVTFDLYYVKKPVIPFFNNFSIANRVFRNLNINEYTSELILGYRFSKFTERLFAGKCSRLCWRPKYYKYFDSFDKCDLDLRPEFNYILWLNNKQLEEEYKDL